MTKNLKERGRVIQVVCPCCRAVLWIDSQTQGVIKTEKGEKKKESLDELLLKEKKKHEEIGRKFELTAEMGKKKLEKAEELFRQGLSKADKED
jgi:adenine-specific DNA methylase